MKMQAIKMQNSKGFTLIELMIVIAIIGVLAAIAIPQYQKYVIRSKAGQAVVAFRPVQTSIDEYVALHKSLVAADIPKFQRSTAAARETDTCSGIVREVDISSIAVVNAVDTATVRVHFYGTIAADGTTSAASNTAATDCQNPQIDRMPSQLMGRVVEFTGTREGAQMNWVINPASAVANNLDQGLYPVFQSL
jgi:type IV pilus assembly protein PilA